MGTVVLIAIVGLVTVGLVGLTGFAWRSKSIDIPFVGRKGFERDLFEHLPGSTHICSLVGCVGPSVMVVVPRIHAELPGAKKLIACVDDRCAVSEIGRSNIQGVSVPVRADDPREVDLDLLVLGDGRVLVDRSYSGRLRASYPNGRKCEPRCLHLTVVYDAGSDRFLDGRRDLRALGLQ